MVYAKEHFSGPNLVTGYKALSRRAVVIVDPRRP